MVRCDWSSDVCSSDLIDPSTKRLTVKDLSTNEETKTDYDKLIISSGARPDYPDIPGDRKSVV